MSDTKKAVIILNDADPVLARVCKNKFKKEADLDSVITSSYKEAVDVIEKEKPDLVLTDIILPNSQETGFDLLKYIRGAKDAKVAKMPVIMFTDLKQESDKKLAKDLGATDYYVKSELMLNDVIHKVQEALN